ncbi:MAG: GAF domain-containing protein, partial [Armatimonadetes bacterium]|nr:GAF domain-containing protein [Armatimonadota bacterium]
MSGPGDADLLAREVLYAFTEGLQCDRGSLWLLNDEGSTFVAREAVHPQGTPSMKDRRLSAASEPFLAALLERAGPVLFPDPQDPSSARLARHESFADLDFGSLLAVPLLKQERLMGFLLLDDTREDHRFSAEDLAVTRSAAVLAAAALEKNRDRRAEAEQ